MAKRNGHYYDQLTLDLFSQPDKKIINIRQRVKKEIIFAPSKKGYSAKSLYHSRKAYNADREDRKAKNDIALKLAKEKSPDKEKIFSHYSGVGKLLVDYDKEKSLSQNLGERKEAELQQIFTPAEIAKFMVELLEPEEGKSVLDLSCGAGIFFNYLSHCKKAGVEVQDEALTICRSLYPDAQLIHDSMENAQFSNEMDYSFGNPPFSLKFKNDSHPLSSEEGNLFSQDLYLYKNFQALKPGGFMAVLVADSWLTEPKLKHKKITKFIKENFKTIAEISLPLNTFGSYICFVPTKVLIFQKNYDAIGDYPKSFKAEMTVFDQIPDILGKWRCSDAYKNFLAEKKKAFLHQSKTKYTEYFKERKSLYEYKNELLKLYSKIDILAKTNIASSKKLKSYLLDCLSAKVEHFDEEKQFVELEKLANKLSFSNSLLSALLFHFNNKPKMDKNSYQYDRWQELGQRYQLKNCFSSNDWNLRKPDLKKAAHLAKRLLKKGEDKDLITIYKTSKHIRIKAHSKKALGLLNQLDILAEKRRWSINKLIITYWADYQKDFFENLEKLNVKGLNYTTKDEARYISIKWGGDLYNYLTKRRLKFYFNRFLLSEIEKNAPKKFNDNLKRAKSLSFAGGGKLFSYQAEDLARALCKKEAFINYDTGTGKLPFALSYIRLISGRAAFITMSSLIDQFKEEIKKFYPELSYYVIKKAGDLKKALQSEAKIFVFSYHSAKKLERRIKKIRFSTMALDESWNIKTASSQIHKTARSLFRKVPYKLLLNATVADNNVKELYNQFLVLLKKDRPENLCEVPKIYKYNRILGEESLVENPDYMLPFNSGLSFEKCFYPKKTSVFGTEKTNQGIINANILLDYVKPLRLRRGFLESFKAVHSKEPDITKSQVLVPVNETEREAHTHIFGELQNLLMEYNTKELSHEDKMARLIAIGQTIRALLTVTSCWWTVRGYGKKYPDRERISSKMIRIKEDLQKLILQKPDIKIIVTSIHRESVEKMHAFLKGHFNLVYLPVTEENMEKRYKKIGEFKESSANIFLATTGKLQAGLNIGCADIWIQDSLPYNPTKLQQAQARIIRINSAKAKEVRYYLGEHTFDLNIYQLILQKLRLQKFVQEDKLIDREELNEEMGGLAESLTAAFKKETDEEGKSQIISEHFTRHMESWQEDKILVQAT